MQQATRKGNEAPPAGRQITQWHARITEQFKQMNNNLKLQTQLGLYMVIKLFMQSNTLNNHYEP